MQKVGNAGTAPTPPASSDKSMNREFEGSLLSSAALSWRDADTAVIGSKRLPVFGGARLPLQPQGVGKVGRTHAGQVLRTTEPYSLGPVAPSRLLSGGDAQK